ncbi:MAG: hypothetical protein KatS3mg126_2257 [Lysobacteraceae bacterium]|nr:MAG: hypothetical protein KatS3mg126_2257 [Xanthomonadaceae bacterium]
MSRWRGLAAALLLALPGHAAQLGAAAASGLAPEVQRQIEQARAEVANLPAEAPAPHKVQALRRLAMVLLAHERNPEALEVLQEALQLQPDDPELHYLASLGEQALGHIEAAETALGKALALAPQMLPAWLRRAELRLARGELEEAAADFRRALELGQADAAAHAGLGRVALQAGDAAAAVEHLRAALAIQPAAGRLRVPLAMALRRLGRTEEAREQLALGNDRPVAYPDPLVEALTDLMRSPTALFEQGRALARAGDLAGARMRLEQAARAVPEEATFGLELTEVLLGLGEIDAAARELQRLKALPTDPAPLADLAARIALRRGDSAEAEARLEEALQLLPEADDLRVELARLQFRREDWQAAAASFAQLAGRVEGEEWAYARYWGAVAEAMAGSCAKALAGMQEVLARSGGRDGWAMLGVARLGALCPPDDATRRKSAGYAQAMLRQFPGVETRVSAAFHAVADGRRDEAEGLLAQALEQARAEGESASHLRSLESLIARVRRGEATSSAYLPGSALLHIR